MGNMLQVFFYCLLFVQAINIYAVNKAIRLDGIDNNIRTGIGILTPPWTLEAWIRGNDNIWREQEVVIGGGEYSDINWVDNLPLVVRNGKVHSHRTDLWGKHVLDSDWHHVAVTCDGNQTSLYVDGVLEDRADTATAVLPGAIGVCEVEPSFNGTIDEVRIWKAAVPEKVLRSWKGRPVSSRHPFIRSLWAYYPLDDFDGETAVNWVGKGHQAYHIRSGRSKFYGDAELARPVVAENSLFKSYVGKQRFFNAVVINSEWDADQGAEDVQIVKLRVAVQGSERPMLLDNLKLDLSGTTSLSDIECIHVYRTGSKSHSEEYQELIPGGCIPQDEMVLDLSDRNVRLEDGINYFLVTFDVKPEAVEGHTLFASVSSFTLDGKEMVPDASENIVRTQITRNSRNDPNVIKVLQWNIWHGGNHLGNRGQHRILETVRATGADIIMMQEAYGIQHMLADSLGYYLKTYSSKDNLALYSRFPFEAIKWRAPFNSNPAYITLPNGRQVLFADCWLRYAYRPEYTSGYANLGWNPDQWVSEDSVLALADIKDILTLDVYPNLKADMPVILTGDFNSCSHLDWTERAKPLHYGYGPVEFPVSRYMYSQGFKDSFREMHPDEVEWQCGTVSAIWGQMQMSRIDFIYYRGQALKVLSSKVIRTAPEIDYVWASDHAAVITVFQVDK